MMLDDLPVKLGEDFECKHCVFRAAWQKLGGGYDNMCAKAGCPYYGMNIALVRECSGARKESK